MMIIHYLSSKILRKNKIHHKDIELSIYKKLPYIIERGQLIIQDKENTLLFIRVSDKYYFCSVKAIRSGETLEEEKLYLLPPYIKFEQRK